MHQQALLFCKINLDGLTVVKTLVFPPASTKTKVFTTDHYFFYRILRCFISGGLLVLALVGCGSSPTPTPAVTPARPLAPTATAQSTSTAVPQAEATTTATITLAPFLIHLPVAAPVFYPTTDNWQETLAQVAQQNSHLAGYLTALAAAATAQTPVALTQPAAGLTLIATLVPAEGLTLQSYLAAAQSELAQSRLTLGSGIVIQNAAIRYDLHEARIPLATIQYTLPDKGDSANSVTSGYQAAMLDQSGKHFLLLTFVTQPMQAAAAQEQIKTILARLQDTTIDQ